LLINTRGKHENSGKKMPFNALFSVATTNCRKKQNVESMAAGMAQKAPERRVNLQ
jgi:hypothetical protein